jgi:GrpB-like predicted nucleotidyltransferase (UPF0157 family)
MSRKIEVVQYDPAWKEMFAREACEISSILHSELVAIHHIGSTAVPGIHAKPVIDILLEVSDIEKLDHHNHRMQILGYQPCGESGIPRRRYFYKEMDGVHTFHLHAYQEGDSEVYRHLSFRDYLKAHPQEAQAYSHLKIELASQFPHDSKGYTDAKTDFIREIVEKAGRS